MTIYSGMYIRLRRNIPPLQIREGDIFVITLPDLEHVRTWGAIYRKGLSISLPEELITCGIMQVPPKPSGKRDYLQTLKSANKEEE